MDDITYSIPTEKDLVFLARHLKENDRKEIIGLSGNGNVLEELKSSVKHSEFSRVCFFGSEPVAVFGIRRMSPFEKVGIVWLLTTPKTQEHKVFVGRTTKRAVRAFMREWKLLYNYVDEENEFSLKWLRFIGAKIYPAKELGIFGVRYHYFEFLPEVVK
ncbi:MAG: hypothetical protein RR910_08425 [Acidaminococcaceae bacterium]